MATDPTACPTCGSPHDLAKCSGHAKSTGRQCVAWPIKGGTVCIKHGGKAPQVRAAANERLGERRAQAAVATFGLPRQIDPRDALLEEVYRTAGAVDWLGEKVRELDPADAVWGRTEEVDKTSGEFPGTDTKFAAAPNIWVELWQKERKHLLDVCKAAIAAGIEERKVRLAEQQGALLAGVIKGILGDLDLSPEQQQKVATVVPLHLRAVAQAA
ncbi:hypothetical protein [Phytohabitans houttuyneae]|uniref:hypothetical protein n=1 Tax=Phytohabitans houttuyneae TaxID=1076126 RepID=UPI001C49A6BA|nr:hypothetical protein [Phytohabitans houttuyneae]